MKTSSLLFASAIVLFASLLLSCGKEAPVPHIRPSVDHAEFNADGGDVTITFPDGDWCIESVLKGELEMKESGSVYNEKGERVGTNTWLALLGLGRLEKITDGFGLIIRRDDLHTLKISFQENCFDTGQAYIIRLQTGDIFKDITLVQEKSAGYRLEDVEYFVKEGDGDVIATELGYGHTYNTYKDDTVQMGIFLGTRREARFECEVKESFQWLGTDTKKVKTPVDFNEQGVVMGTDEMKYNSEKWFFNLPKEMTDLRHEVHYKKGSTLLQIMMEFRTRKLSYTATMVNNKSGKKRLYHGSWHEKTPTGKYKLTTQYLGE